MASNGTTHRDTDLLLEESRKAILRSQELIVQTKSLLEQPALLLGRSAEGQVPGHGSDRSGISRLAVRRIP